LSHRYCYLPLSWKRWNRFECGVGGVCHTRCCWYSFCAFNDGWWYHPKHAEQFPGKINCVTLPLVRYILKYISYIIIRNQFTWGVSAVELMNYNTMVEPLSRCCYTFITNRSLLIIRYIHAFLTCYLPTPNTFFAVCFNFPLYHQWIYLYYTFIKGLNLLLDSTTVI
jgi:hypothetical protein